MYDIRLEQKNECFDEKLNELKKTNLYKTVLSEFTDTFKVLKNVKENFGVASYVKIKIDDAIFFKKDSSECLLIVLEKMKDSVDGFGSARIISGKDVQGRWKFEVSLDYYFEKDYFGLYPQNTFDNIAKIARYSVLVNNNSSVGGCEINDEYWFSILKDD